MKLLESTKLNPFLKALTKLYWPIVTLFILLAFPVMYDRPMTPQAFNYYDDDLYFHNAIEIARGDSDKWLGAFDIRVISKAPLYSIFLAFCHESGLPLRLLEYIVVVPMLPLFVLAVSPILVRKKTILLFAVLLLLWLPVLSLDYRIIREGFFGTMVLYTLVGLLGFLVSFYVESRLAAGWAILSGLCFGLTGIIREEASWLLAPLMLVFAIIVILTVIRKKYREGVLLLMAMMLFLNIPKWTISYLNGESYGVFSPSLRQDDDFRSLFSMLISLEFGIPEESDPKYKTVPISEKGRLLLYEMSPRFNELRPFLDGKALNNLARHRRQLEINGWSETEREFFVSNFEFALTKAIFLAGYDSGGSFVNYCRDATLEFRALIEKGLVHKRTSILPMLPTPTSGDFVPILSATLESASLLFRGKGLESRYMVRRRALTESEIDWHYFLKTWPPVHLNSQFHAKDVQRVFKNEFLVFLMRGFYGIAPVVFVFCLFKLWNTNRERFVCTIICISIGVSALSAFCLVMGIADTIAWPILQDPRTYNRMGFVPLHFLTLLFLSFSLGGVRSLEIVKFGKLGNEEI